MRESSELTRAEHFTCGTVGEPGQRVFFIQARQGRRLVTLKSEKEQVRALGEYLGELLEKLPGETAATLPDTPLIEPIEPAWPIASIALGYDEGQTHFADLDSARAWRARMKLAKSGPAAPKPPPPPPGVDVISGASPVVEDDNAAARKGLSVPEIYTGKRSVTYPDKDGKRVTKDITITITLTSNVVNSGVVTGNVPNDGGTIFLRARLPAIASIGMIIMKRPTSIAIPIVVLYQRVSAEIPANADPLLPVPETNA